MVLTISRACCLWEPLSALWWWTLCVCERCFRRSVDGLQEMELGNQWEEQWLIQYLSSQGLKQHYYTLPTSHTRSYLQGFCLPSAFTAEKGSCLYTTPFIGASLPVPRRWQTGTLYRLWIEWKNRKLWKVWHRRTPSEEHRHRRRVVLSRVAVCAIQKSVRWLDWWRIKISLLLKEHVYGLRFPQSTGSPP